MANALTLTAGVPVPSDNAPEIAFPVQFDDGDSTCVSFKSILLLPNDYKNPKGPSPMPSGRRRLRIDSNPVHSRSRKNPRIESDGGKIETTNGSAIGSSDGKCRFGIKTLS